MATRIVAVKTDFLNGVRPLRVRYEVEGEGSVITLLNIWFLEIEIMHLLSQDEQEYIEAQVYDIDFDYEAHKWDSNFRSGKA